MPGAVFLSFRKCLDAQYSQIRSARWGWPEVGLSVNEQVCIYQKENLIVKDLLL